MKSQITEPKDSSALIALSSLSFILVLILVLATPFIDMSGEVTIEQKAYRIYGYGLVGLLQVALVVTRGLERSLRIFVTGVIPFLIWAGLSLAWTQDVDLTSKRLVLLLLVYAGIFSGFCDLSHQRALGTLRLVLAAALIVNFAAVLLVPDIGVHNIPGGIGLWRGLMAHKNIAGMLCAFTILVFVFDGSRIPLVGRLAVIGAALTFLVASWSKTALITLPIALTAGGIISLVGERNNALVDPVRNAFTAASRASFILIIAILAILTIEQDILIGFTDDTSLVTTRGAIWRPMIQFYLDNPLLGTGYGAYWDAPAGLIDQTANKGLWKNVDQGHNGYLDLLVQLGLPGLVLALFAALAWPLAQLARVIGRQPQRAALIFAVIVFSLIENVSETSLFADDALGNAILLIALAQLHRFRLRSSNIPISRRRRRSGSLVAAPDVP